METRLSYYCGIYSIIYSHKNKPLDMLHASIKPFSLNLIPSVTESVYIMIRCIYLVNLTSSHVFCFINLFYWLCKNSDKI